MKKGKTLEMKNTNNARQIEVDAQKLQNQVQKREVRCQTA